jgi:fructose-1-phosphate kinase PfkB-like protein
MTAAAGHTRQNVTVVDMANDRDMHLRNKSTLATRSSLRRLKGDLQATVSKNSLCVFAGAMPQDELLGDIVGLVKGCNGRGARIVVDTSGPALRALVDTGCVWLIKPNVEELRELVGEQITDGPAGLAGAARRLLNKVEIVLVSRGKKGALVVTAHGAWRGQCRGRRRIASTVGCGDYLLAGFIKALKQGTRPDLALATGLKAASARAWGWHETATWAEVRRRIKVQRSRVS